MTCPKRHIYPVAVFVRYWEAAIRVSCFPVAEYELH